MPKDKLGNIRVKKLFLFAIIRKLDKCIESTSFGGNIGFILFRNIFTE